MDQSEESQYRAGIEARLKSLEEAPQNDSQFGSIANIRDWLAKAGAAIADLQARVEPLQEVTNALNEFRQRLDAIEQMAKVGQ